MLSALCCWSSVLVFHQTHWLCVYRLWGVALQCWVFWDEACQMVSLQWLEPSVSAFRCGFWSIGTLFLGWIISGDCRWFVVRRVSIATFWVLSTVVLTQGLIWSGSWLLWMASDFRCVMDSFRYFVVRLWWGNILVSKWSECIWSIFVGLEIGQTLIADVDLIWYWTLQVFVFWSVFLCCFDAVSRLLLKQHLLTLSDIVLLVVRQRQWLVVSDVCFWSTAVGTDITACLSQLFGSWVHWWRRVLCCDDVVKTENLDWIFLLDVSFLLRLTFDASVLWVRRVVLRLLGLSAFVSEIDPVSQYLSVFRACRYFSGYLLHVCRFRYGMLSVVCFWGIFLESLF